METGEQLLNSLKGHTGTVQSVAILPDCRRIASGSHDKTMRVWDMETGKQVLGSLVGHIHAWDFPAGEIRLLKLSIT